MKKVPFHPLLITLFPILSLYVSNIRDLRFTEIIPSVVIALLAGSVLWFFINLFFHDIRKSAFSASVLIFLFFSFESFFPGLEMFAIMTGIFRRPYYLSENMTLQYVMMLVFLVLWFGLTRLTRRSHWNRNRLTLTMNAISLVLLAGVGFYWAKTIIQDISKLDLARAQIQARWNSQLEQEKDLLGTPEGRLPTIYYIILDGYARQDVLSDMYRLDNAEFINFLEKKGFYVAEESTANYKSTALSLASSLNFFYLNTETQKLGDNLQDIDILRTMVDRSRVFEQLRRKGYQIVRYTSGFTCTDFPSADIRLSAGTTLNNFQNTLINNTPLSVFLRGNQYGWHRQNILFTLEHLTDPLEYEKPTFVFTHLVAPHPPFVFDAEGEPIYPNRNYSINDANTFMISGTKEEYQQGYRDQLKFINKKIMAAIQSILDTATSPPVIIIQSDHGPGSELNMAILEKTNLHERFPILNAYYLPGKTDNHLYSSITPVNSFRVVFNEYFNAGLPLLEDRNYFSPLEDPFIYTEVTDDIQ